MQISILIHNLERVVFDFFILYDIKIHHAKFHNSTPKCSDQMLSKCTTSIKEKRQGF